MGHHNETFRTLAEVRQRGQPWWWLSAYVCRECGQGWLVAQEERINDIFIMRKLRGEETEQLLENDRWPDDFDLFARLLEIGRRAGRIHFFNPESSLLFTTTVDLAGEQPNIPLTKIASLLNLDLAAAEKLARRAIASNGAAIGLAE
jgi:hypothetical protein